RAGSTGQRHRPRANVLSGRGQQSQLVAHSLHVRHGAAGAVHQRFHQGRLDGSVAVRALHRGRADPGNATDDRHLDVGQGGSVSVA
nr:hypothetical protein [Tanacetum cinerariifolium]